MNQLKIGALLSYLNIFLTNIIGLVLTPFIVRSLGESEYGLYVLIGSLIAYLALMDFGLNNTIVRFISKYRVENKYQEERQFLGMVMIIYMIISFVLVIIGLVLYFNLDNIFAHSLSLNQIHTAKIMFLILVFNMAITLPSGTFLAITNAYERFVFSRIVTIFKYILRTLTVFIVLSYGGKSISIVVIDTIFSILVTIVTFLFCHYKLNIRFDFNKLDKAIIKQIFDYSIWVFILTIVMNFQWNAGQIILGINSNTIVVGILSVGLMLGGYFGAFSGVINTLLLPKAAHAVSENQSFQELTNTMIKVGRVNVFLSFLILSGFYILGKEFIALWLGKVYVESWGVAIIIMLISIVPLSQSFGISILEIKNKIKFRAISMLFSIIIAITASYFLSKQFGMYGVIVPIAIAGVYNTIINNILFVKVFNFNYLFFFRKVFIYPTTLTIVLVVIFNSIKNFIIINSWIRFSLFALVFSVIYLTMYFLLIFDKEEKQMIFKHSTR